MLTHQRFHHISINLLASILPVIAHDFRLLLIRNGDIEIDKNGFSFPQDELKEAGMDLPYGILSIDELVDELVPLLK